MAYLALYREWRPQKFSDIVGQDHISRTLQNAIKANRIAHAYLFCGPRGTGKTTTAKVLAKALNCLSGPAAEPCNQCENCNRITDGISMDVMEIDAASNRGIDEIRDLREKVKYSPTEGRFRIYIIDEVHMLTTEAFNALLKTLEEPPGHVLFVLATTEPHKIPMTILSRCQRFDFKRIGVKEIAQRLADVCQHLQIETDEETLNLLAKTAEGGLRDALSILDQCISFGGNKVSVEEVTAVLGTVNQEFLFKMVDCIIDRDTTTALFLINETVNQGKDLRQFSKDLTEHLRNLLLMQVSQNAGELIPVTEHILNMLGEQTQKIERNLIMRSINIFSTAEREIRWSTQPRMVLELAVIEACSKPQEYELQELLDRVRQLEKVLAENPQQSGKTQSANPTKSRRKGDGKASSLRDVSIDAEAGHKSELLHEEAASISVEQIVTKWPEVMEKVKKVKRTVHAFLLEGKPVKVAGTTLILAFSEEYSFHKENIEKKENRETIEGIIKEVVGSHLTIQCKFTSQLESLEAHVKERPSEDPILEKAIELFGAEVIEFND